MKQEHLEALALKYNLDVAVIRRIIASQFEKVILSISEKKSVRIPHIGTFQYSEAAYENMLRKTKKI